MFYIIIYVIYLYKSVSSLFKKKRQFFLSKKEKKMNSCYPAKHSSTKAVLFLFKNTSKKTVIWHLTQNIIKCFYHFLLFYKTVHFEIQ